VGNLTVEIIDGARLYRSGQAQGGDRLLPSPSLFGMNAAGRLAAPARELNGGRKEPIIMRWTVDALFSRWFERRLEEGFVEYIPAGPPRRVRRSIAPADVTHFAFWSRWPRPFFRTLDRVLQIGYPVLWNVTITGLGGTEVEPHVPSTEKAIASVIDLSHIVPAATIQWRYDPLFLSEHFDARHHLDAFTRIAEVLSGHVDRVTTSPVEVFARRVKPDLFKYEQETGDRLVTSGAILELVHRLREIADAAGIPFTLCCAPVLRAAIGCEPAGCNSWAWATRVYPQLRQHRPLRDQPTRPDCACSKEFDVGAYDTCTLGCRYSYGSCDLNHARLNFAKHDSGAACLIP
jgi:hypothetical protein